MEILRVENLSKVYGKGENKVFALDNVSFSVEKGEFVAIVGASGSGKSTLLHLVGGVDRPTKGKVFIDGKNIYEMNDDKLAIFRRRQVGLIYQFYYLIPILNVEENITLPLELDNREVDKKTLKELLVNYLIDFELALEVMNKINMIDFFKKLFGENLDKALDLDSLTIYGYNELIAKIDILLYHLGFYSKKSINTKENETTISEKKETIEKPLPQYTYERKKTPFKHPFFKEFINLLPSQYQLITSLRLGLYDGKMYSIQEIADTFNLNISDTKESLEKSIDLFKLLVNRYKELYGVSFPDLDNETNRLLLMLNHFE